MSLHIPTPEIKSASMRAIVEMPGISRYEIANRFGVSDQTVGSRIHSLLDTEMVEESKRQKRNKRYGRGIGAYELVATDAFWDKAGQTTAVLIEEMNATEMALYASAFGAREALQETASKETIVVDDVDRRHYPDNIREVPVIALSEKLLREADYLGKVSVLASYSNLLDEHDLFVGAEGWNLLISAQVLGSQLKS